MHAYSSLFMRCSLEILDEEPEISNSGRNSKAKFISNI